MLDKVANALVALLGTLAGVVLGALTWVEHWFGGLMTSAHIPANLQTVFAVVLGILFIVAAVQLFAGFIRVVVIVVLVAIAVHAVSHGRSVAPPLQHGWAMPAGASRSG
jgi:hypothetical protein